MVLPPSRRDTEVRGEPAEALPGHLQRRLRLRGLARAVAGATRRRPALGSRGRQGVPRRQPAHEAGRVLGMAYRRSAAEAPGGDLPRRGVYAPDADDDAREGGLRPEL